MQTAVIKYSKKHLIIVDFQTQFTENKKNCKEQSCERLFVIKKAILFNENCSGRCSKGSVVIVCLFNCLIFVLSLIDCFRHHNKRRNKQISCFFYKQEFYKQCQAVIAKISNKG